MTFYAVYVPGLFDSNSEKDPPFSEFIFEKRADALKAMKEHKQKQPRLKDFATMDEAKRFLKDGDDFLNCENHISAPEKRPSTPAVKRNMSTGGNEETPRPFSEPTRQQLTEFKKIIESKNAEKLRETAESNPRFLINCNGDTPTIIQEGCRYNALHVAVKSGDLESVQTIVELFRTDEYVERLYPDDKDPDTTGNRRRLLLDLYLNMPDKGVHETPLHFACKNGHVDIVRYLCSQVECIRDPINKYGQSPADVCEERAPAETKMDIIKILQGLPEEQYFVPLYRTKDEAFFPILQKPVKGFPPSRIQKTTTEEKNSDILEYVLAAYVGPIATMESAQKIHRDWSSKNFGPQHEKNQNQLDKEELVSLKRTDLHKGLERIGRRVAGNQYAWCEYWKFLRAFADLKTEDGLRRLEAYFREKATFDEEESKNGNSSTKNRLENCRRKLEFTRNEDDNSSRDSIDSYFDTVDNKNVEKTTEKNQNISTDSSPDNSDLRNRLHGISVGDENAENANDKSTSFTYVEEDSRDGYFTPPEELSAEVILGSEPTKIDMDVFAALENVRVDENRYPRTFAWTKMVREYTDEERKRWVPVDSPRSAVQTRSMKAASRKSKLTAEDEKDYL